MDTASFPSNKKDRGIYMLYTPISRKSQLNSLTANARFIRNIETRLLKVSWMDFSSIHMSTCSIKICTMLLFSVNTFHFN